jgi:hypothetical protein
MENMTEKKPMNKQDFIRYILSTPIDEITENPDVVFTGDTEKARAMSQTRFTQIRGIMQRCNQILVGDDNEALVATLKTCIALKQE